MLDVDQLAGGMARVSYTFAVPELNQARQPWTREAGAKNTTAAGCSSS
ncbi:hypothetical protein BX286_0045 [Streptomyces sp. 3211.6]|nr:hypothetical protein [Streptomyces sp. 3211.6]RKT02180.1 hypothetical protein BX286_0045 [Streptomyces sp. 3211.6]